MFAVRQVCEKYLANGKDVFWALISLEKAYDTIDRHGIRQMLRVHVWTWKKIVESNAEFLYIDSRACVKVGNNVSCFRLMLD